VSGSNGSVSPSGTSAEEAFRPLQSLGSLELPAEAGAVLLVELDGPREGIAREREVVLEVARGLGASPILTARDARERDRMWELRRVVSPALLSRSPGRINEDIVIPRSRIPEMLTFLAGLSRDFALPIANFGHAGDGNIHVNVLIDTADPTHLERAEKIVDRLFRRTIEMGGTLSGEHGIGLTKKDYLPLELGHTELTLMRRLKHLLDPRGILNPGKIFPAERVTEPEAAPAEEPGL
jgi:glycolate oxidase